MQRLTQPLLVHNLQEFRHFDDAHSLIAAEPQKMVIARDQVFGLIFHRAFEYAIVSRIFFNDIKLLFWRYSFSEVADAFTEERERLFALTEFITQHAQHFFHDVLRNRKLDKSRTGHFKQIVGRAAEMQRGNIYCCCRQ